MRRLFACKGFKQRGVVFSIHLLAGGPSLKSLNPGYIGRPIQGRFHWSISQVPLFLLFPCLPMMLLPALDAPVGLNWRHRRLLMLVCPRRLSN